MLDIINVRFRSNIRLLKHSILNILTSSLEKIVVD